MHHAIGTHSRALVVVCHLLAAGAAFSTSITTHAATPYSLEVDGGRGSHINVYGIAANLRSDWQARTGPVNWGLYWQGRLQHWEADSALGGNRSLTLAGVMPVLRATRGPTDAAGLFLDLGLGANLISRHQIGNRDLSTTFQFGELIGIGYAFGARRQWEIAARLQHVSNAGIKEPNAGLTYSSLSLRYGF